LISDLVALFVRPGALFAEFHRLRRTGPALALLAFLHLLYAGALLSTGVPDYEIQAQAQTMINREAEKLKGDEDSDELTRTVETLEKMASFNQVFSRIALLAGGPVRLLVGIALVSSVLFLIVSLAGIAKADFAQIAAVVVFASYTEVPRLLVKLLLVSQLHVLRVETSLAALLSHPKVAPALFLLLRRFDPFEFWYWGLIGLGLWKTGQLSGRRAFVVVVVLALAVGLLQGCLGAGDLVETEGMIKIGDKE
jgi:hypothetical protein